MCLSPNAMHPHVLTAPSIIQCLLTGSSVINLSHIHHLLATCLGNHLGDPLLHQRLHRGLDRVHGVTAAKCSGSQVGDPSTLANLKNLLLATDTKPCFC